MNQYPDQLLLVNKENLPYFSEDSLTSNSFYSKFLLTESVSSESHEEISNEEENRSVVVKSACQDYDGMLDGWSKKSFEQGGKDSNSLALTTAKGSLVENQKKREGCSRETLINNVFAIQGRFFCKACCQNVLSYVRYGKSRKGFWGNLKNLLKESKCCAGNEDTTDIIHLCPLCKTVLVRITDV